MRIALISVTVKAWLRGHEFDLEDLVDLLPRGDTRVVKDVDGYYLSSVEIDHRPEGVPFYEVAPRVLRRINGLGRVHNPKFEPVGLTGRYTEEGKVHAVVTPDTARIRTRVSAPVVVVTGSDGQVVPPVPPPPPRGLARAQVAAARAEVDEALEIMGHPDPLGWIQLYKIFEIVRDDVKPDSIADLGWASEIDVSAFTGSANRPDVGGAGARHARMGGSPPRRQMTEDAARDFISRLVASWIDFRRRPPKGP